MPFSGPIKLAPRCLRISTFATVAGGIHIFPFIAGASSTGASRPESPSNQNPTDSIWPPLHGAGGQPEDSGTRKGRIRLSWLHPLLGEDTQRRVCGQTQDSRQADEPGPQSD